MPSLPVVFHPDAIEEATVARLWYAERSQSAGDSFLAELDHGIASISIRQNADRCLCITLGDICFDGFRSRLCIVLPTTVLRLWQLLMADGVRAIGERGKYVPALASQSCSLVECLCTVTHWLSDYFCRFVTGQKKDEIPGEGRIFKGQSSFQGPDSLHLPTT